jgi:hypothetical protein
MQTLVTDKLTIGKKDTINRVINYNVNGRRMYLLGSPEGSNTLMFQNCVKL